MRYLREIRWRFQSESYRRYAGEARTALGIWLATLGEGVTTATYRRVRPDGVVFDFRLHGSVPIISISVPTATPVRAATAAPGVVVTPRNAEFPDGQHPTNPEAVLIPVTTIRQAKEWAAAWPDGTADGFADTLPPKGTYLESLPAGVGAGGNIDWRGPGGVRLTWYGPNSRYWWDPQEPNAFPKQWVFYGGSILLDATAYAAAAEAPAISGGVAGAAFWRDADGVRWLHVVHLSGSTHTLVRYGLAPAGPLLAVTGYEVIETLTLANSKSPWLFSEDGSKAVHMTDPVTGFWGAGAAPTQGEIARLLLAPDGTAAFSTFVHSMAGTSADSAVVALDYSGDDEVSIACRVLGVGNARISIGGVEFITSFSGTSDQAVANGDVVDAAAIAAAGPDDGGVGAYIARRVAWADARSGMCVFLHTAVVVNATESPTVNTLVLMLRGQVVLSRRIAITKAAGLPDLNGLQPIALFNTQPDVSPRLRMVAFHNTVGVPPIASGWLVAYAAQQSQSPWQDRYVRTGWASSDIHRWYARASTAPFHREYGYQDARGHWHYVVGYVEGEHALLSIYTPVLRNTGSDGSGPPFTVEQLDDRQAVNWITFTLFPERLGTEDGDAVFYPGYPLGLTASTS